MRLADLLKEAVGEELATAALKEIAAEKAKKEAAAKASEDAIAVAVKALRAGDAASQALADLVEGKVLHE